MTGQESNTVLFPRESHFFHPIQYGILLLLRRAPTFGSRGVPRHFWQYAQSRADTELH